VAKCLWAYVVRPCGPELSQRGELPHELLVRPKRITGVDSKLILRTMCRMRRSFGTQMINGSDKQSSPIIVLPGLLSDQGRDRQRGS
jgi:hypothetical protein